MAHAQNLLELRNRKLFLFQKKQQTQSRRVDSSRDSFMPALNTCDGMIAQMTRMIQAMNPIGADVLGSGILMRRGRLAA